MTRLVASRLERDDDAPLSPREAADLAARYKALKDADYLIPSTGERLAAKEYDRELAALNKRLKAHVDAEGPFHVEGIGTLRVQERTAEYIDLPSLHQHDPLNFFRLLEVHALKCDTTVVDQQRKAGNIVMQPGPRVTTSRALVIDR